MYSPAHGITQGYYVSFTEITLANSQSSEQKRFAKIATVHRLKGIVMPTEDQVARLVLYVEDNPSTARLFSIAVEELDCSIRLVVAEDRGAAIAFLTQEEILPDLVVLDLNLPGVDGLTMLKEIRSTQRLAHLSTVIFSTSTLAIDEERARMLGVADFVHKPLELEAFMRAVKKICGRAMSAGA